MDPVGLHESTKQQTLHLSPSQHHNWWHNRHDLVTMIAVRSG
ncbi:unnamed protein product [Brassica oleracea var. botrytis]